MSETERFAVDSRRPHVRYYKDVVVKSGMTEQLRIEAAKTACAYRISRDTGIFRVPEVKHFDELKGEITLERIPGLTRTRMQNLLAYDLRERARIVEKVGRCLAVIHQQLVLGPDLKIPVDDTIDWANDQVFVHGDFNIQNVTCLPGNEIVVIDWQMTRHHGGESTYGTYYFDLAWFMMNLFFIRVAGLRYSLSFPMTGLAIRFARSYLQESGRSAEDFGQYFQKFFRSTMPAMWPNNRRQKVYMTLLLPFRHRFISRCSNL